MCKKQKLFLLVYAKYNVFLSFDFWGEIHIGIRSLQKTDFISFYKVNIIKDQKSDWFVYILQSKFDKSDHLEDLMNWTFNFVLICGQNIT